MAWREQHITHLKNDNDMFMSDQMGLNWTFGRLRKTDFWGDEEAARRENEAIDLLLMDWRVDVRFRQGLTRTERLVGLSCRAHSKI